MNIWTTLLLAVLVIVGVALLIYYMRFLYAWWQGKKRVYLRVTMPRREVKKFKEEENEKDFRESIAQMEQLIRSLHEMRELDLANWSHTLIWNYDNTVFEIVCRNKQVYFYVVTQERYKNLISKKITSYYVDADIEEVKAPEISPKNKFMRIFNLYYARSFYLPIKTYKIIEQDAINDFTNIFSEMKADESAVIQLVLDPRSRGWSKKATKIATERFKGQQGGDNIISRFFRALFFGSGPSSRTYTPGVSEGDSYVRMLQSDEEIWKNVGLKARQPGFNVTIRILAIAKTHKRMRELMNSLLVSFNIFLDQGMNWFQAKRVVPIDWLNNKVMFFNFRHRLNAYHGERSSLMVPEEIASIYHFPNSVYNKTPVIKYLSFKSIPAPGVLPNEGLLLGKNHSRGKDHLIHILEKDRSRHMYVLGKSGTGKSYLLGEMAKQDIANNQGLAVIDPHGDLVRRLANYIPAKRIKETIYFQPGDQERPMGLNILEANTPAEAEMAAIQATDIFIKIFGNEIFGPRIQHYFRNGCLTLMEDQDEGATLIDVPRLFVDEAFRKYKVAKVQNPTVRSFWMHEYENTAEREKKEIIPYFSSKFGPFITNRTMRNIVGQSKSGFNFQDVMDSGKILLIDLSKGDLGDLNTQLLGLVMVAKFQSATMMRSKIEEKQRKPFYLYVDEFQNYATESFATLLSEARKYNLGLIMAHQYLRQIQDAEKTSLREAVFGNIGALVCFRVSAEDAEYLEKEFGSPVTAHDLANISRFNAYCKMTINNRLTRPFSMESIYADQKGIIEGRAKFIRDYSRMKYGRKLEMVNAEIEHRIGIS